MHLARQRMNGECHSPCLHLKLHLRFLFIHLALQSFQTKQLRYLPTTHNFVLTSDLVFTKSLNTLLNNFQLEQVKYLTMYNPPPHTLHTARVVNMRTARSSSNHKINYFDKLTFNMHGFIIITIALNIPTLQIGESMILIHV